MQDAGWEPPMWLATTTEDPGYGMAEQALGAGVDLVLACGGDGTARAVLTVLAGSGTPLGVIPLGTGNLSARNLGLPLNDPLAALLVAPTGDGRLLDVAVIVSHDLRDWARVATRIILRRRHIDHRYTTYQGKQITVSLTSAQPRQLDGDLIASSTVLAVQVEPGALTVRAPAGAT